MQIKSLFVLALTGSALTACNDVASPRGILKSAYSAASKGDLERFVSYLDGSAKAQYGSARGVERLKAEFAGTKPKLAPETLVESVRTGDRSYRETYTVRVYDGGNPFRDATIVCNAKEFDGEICTPDTPDTDIPRRPRPPQDSHSTEWLDAGDMATARPLGFGHCTPTTGVERSCKITRFLRAN